MKFLKLLISFSALALLLYCSNSQESTMSGCTDPEACNYDSGASEENGSCLYDDCLGVCGGDAEVDCTGICGGAYRLDDCGDCLHPQNQSAFWNAACSGCMDESAPNYNPSAIIDDGSCIEEFPDGWNLVWNDEFNSENIDLSRWTHEIWGPYHVNNELQAYTNRPQNSYIEDGHLVIKGLQENYQGAEYTSARLNTAGKAEFQYGRYDIRAKLPMGQGTWPAIWMLGTNIGQVGWPACGELDIMEHVNTGNGISSSLHSADCNHADPSNCPDYSLWCLNGCWGAPNTYGINIANPGDWHVYGMIRTANNITFTVDDNPFMVMNRPINSSDSNWPVDQDYFFILNLALGGDWPGDPDDDIFPITFEIDYVRVYTPE